MKVMIFFGTLSCYGENNGLKVTILSGDKDTFQLATDKVIIRIPHTKAGKTETDEYDRKKIIECIKNNNHNSLTTIYYLLVKKKLKQGIETESDMISNKFQAR